MNDEAETKTRVVTVRKCIECMKPHEFIDLIEAESPFTMNGKVITHMYNCPITGNTVFVSLPSVVKGRPHE